jgi:hypothetical protein
MLLVKKVDSMVGRFLMGTVPQKFARRRSDRYRQGGMIALFML